MQRRFLSVAEFGELMNIPPATIYSLIAQKQLQFPIIRLGRAIRIDCRALKLEEEAER